MGNQQGNIVNNTKTNTNTNQNKDNLNISKFIRQGITISDIENISKAFKLLDNDNDGLITYDIEKIGDCKYYNYTINHDIHMMFI